MSTLSRTRLGMLVASVAVVASGCNSDPMSSDAYLELVAERDSVVAERDEVLDDVESMQHDLAASQERIDAAETAAMTATDAAAIEATERRQVEQLLVAVVDDLDTAFDLTAFKAADWLSCGDTDTIAALPDDIATLREDVAAAVGWFETAAEYDTCGSRRAFLTSERAIYRQNNPAIEESWEDYWDAEIGSDDEAMLWYEFDMWRILITLNAIEGARDVAQRISPDEIGDPEDA